MDRELRELERKALAGDSVAMKSYEKRLAAIGMGFHRQYRALLAGYCYDKKREVFYFCECRFCECRWSQWADNKRWVKKPNLYMSSIRTSKEMFAVKHNDWNVYIKGLKFIDRDRLYLVLDVETCYKTYNLPPDEVENTEEMWDRTEWDALDDAWKEGKNR